MKKILPLIILFFGVAAWSNANPNDDSKYLKGAVPEVDGKVVFERQININQSVTSQQLFDLVKAWSELTFAPKEDSDQRILLMDDELQTIAIQGEEILVFKSSFISIDRTTMQYRLILKIESGKVLMTFSNIKYDYQDFKGLEKAENLIVDKVVYNEKKNSLNRYYDKFRIFTIDAIDNKVVELKKYLEKVSVDKLDKESGVSLHKKQQEQSLIQEETNTVSIVNAEEPSIVKIPAVVVAQNKVEDGAAFEGYKLIKNVDVITSYQAMIAQSKLIVVNGEGEPLLASWNGLNESNGQDVSMITVAKNESNTINDTYTVSFINNSIYKDELNQVEKGSSLTLKNNAYSEAWMIIVCKKMMTIPATSNQDSSLSWDKLSKEDKVLLMGNIKQIWVR